MKLDMNTITTVSRRKATAESRANAGSVLIALNQYGAQYGLLLPHRLAQFLAQIMHESGEFHYDEEVWGPTPAQQRYEDRADLGHSAAVDNEAYMFRGKTGIQNTGRANHIAYRDWCRTTIGGNVPDFERDPEAMLTDPWEGLAPIWYWDSRKLNRYADTGDIEMITRRINGGLNGYADRLALYDRISLVFLGYGPTEVRTFQTRAKAAGVYKGEVDGLSGPKTRAAMHKSLAALSGVSVPAAPVTEDKPVAPEQIDKPVTQTTGFWERITQLLGLTGIGGLAAFFQDWRAIVALAGVLIVVAIIGLILHKRIIDAVRNIKQEIGNA
jgi:putative chitinase